MKTQQLTSGDAVNLRSGGAVGDADRRPSRSASDEDTDTRAVHTARRIWSEAFTINGTVGEAYFRFCGVALPTAPVLRFHPACPLGSERWPAVVAILQDPITGAYTGISRIFVQPDGQGTAKVATPRMTLGGPGVVRLAESDGEGLGLTEGIETGLAIQVRIAWGPVWATCGPSGMRDFPVLPATSLTIFVNTGRASLEAARDCANRWHQAGAEVRRCIPPTRYPNPFNDWLDVVREIA